MAAEGLDAMAALTQLTSLNASYIPLPAKVSAPFGSDPARIDIRDNPGVLGLLSSLTGALYMTVFCHAIVLLCKVTRCAQWVIKVTLI